MSRLLRHLPMLALAAFFGLGQAWGHDPARLRPLTLGLVLLLIPVMVYLGRRGQASPIHLTMAGFLGLAGLAFALAPQTAAGLGAWWLVLFYLLLTLMASLPQVLGRPPFTVYFARQTTPQAVWRTDVFRVINRDMSWVWAGLFALGALAASLPLWLPALATPLGDILCRYLLPAALMLGLGLPLNKRYPAWYQRRLGLIPAEAAPPAVPEPARPDPASDHLYAPHAPTKEETMSQTPTVVALNGSPHAGIGNSAQMIEMLRPGLTAQGLALEVITLAGQEIVYCQGCGWCMEKGACWIKDDHRAIMQRLLEADAVILASPVYFFHVTAQMKTFLDRCLAWGHKPRTSWKPGLAISVAASVGEVETAEYLGGVLKVFGAFSVGRFTALATGPGGFLGLEAVQARADDLAADLARAVKEKRRYPATGHDLIFYLFMKDLVAAHKDSVMGHDYKHWQDCGLLESFEAYVGQKQTHPPFNSEMRQAWIKQMMAARQAGQDPAKANRAVPPSPQPAAAPAGPQAARTCRELLRMMPLGFNPQAAQGLSAIYQLEVREGEEFTAHLAISDGACQYVEGPAPQPDVIIKTPAHVWLAIAQGRQDGQAAFMSGQYQVEGNLMLLLRLKELFGGPAA
ncbi:MAG: NAD(P)H-dependent oxidoreductase [Desulfarculus sp.]|nr:NAD(P)H-dependent oxidoreductase [Desulfarculus sp.]